MERRRGGSSSPSTPILRHEEALDSFLLSAGAHCGAVSVGSLNDNQPLAADG
jgi:hypothetical protein